MNTGHPTLQIHAQGDGKTRLACFDQRLEGHLAALLDGPAKQYPEVLFETRQP